MTELLEKLEWSGRTQGQGTSMGAGNGTWYHSCPVCRGLRGKPNEFREEAWGHKPDCELRQELNRLTRVEHSDDRAVDRFASAMKDKLAFARDHRGRGGWEDKAACSQADLSRMLRDHVDKGDPVDVANFCMMLHQRGERVKAPPKLEDLDAQDVIRALLAGHLSPMTEHERMAYADAPAFCLCGEVGDFFVTVGWEPEDADWRCEAYLGDEAALVDLKEGTWERL